MLKEAAMFSTKRRPGRGTRISILPDPDDIGIVEVITVSNPYGDGSWRMKVKSESGQTLIVSSESFKYWIREQEDSSPRGEMGNLKDFLLPGVGGGTTGLIDIRDFEEGLSQTSSWLSRTMRFSSSDRV